MELVSRHPFWVGVYVFVKVTCPRLVWVCIRGSYIFRASRIVLKILSFRSLAVRKFPSEDSQIRRHRTKCLPRFVIPSPVHWVRLDQMLVTSKMILLVESCLVCAWRKYISSVSRILSPNSNWGWCIITTDSFGLLVFVSSCRVTLDCSEGW
jgi:hypothetical protein